MFSNGGNLLSQTRPQTLDTTSTRGPKDEEGGKKEGLGTKGAMVKGGRWWGGGGNPK